LSVRQSNFTLKQTSNPKERRIMLGKTTQRVACTLFVLTLYLRHTFSSATKSSPPTGHRGTTTATRESAPANATFFTNLGPTPTNNYNAASGGYYVTGQPMRRRLASNISRCRSRQSKTGHVTQVQLLLVTSREPSGCY